MQFLDLCREHGVKVIFPTKTLPFGIEGVTEAGLENLLKDFIMNSKR